MSRHRMANRVRACRLGEPGISHSLFYRLLQHGFVKMVPASFSRYFVCKMAGCWKYPLPAPLFPSIQAFALECIGQSDPAHTSLKIALVLSSYHVKVLGERFFDCCGKHCVAVLITLTGPGNDLIAGEIDVLDSQPQAFHQSEACSIKQHGHDPIGAVEEAENRPDFRPCQHNR